MNNKLNKKAVAGFTPWIIVGVVLVALIVFIGLSKGVFGLGKLDSLTHKSAGYNPENCPDMGVVVGGYVNVEDSGGFTLNPSLKGISVDEVKVEGQDLLCFFCTESEFTYSVKGKVNGDVRNTFNGQGTLKSSDNKGINKPYSLSFTIPDFDCNRAIDDFDLNLIADLKSSDMGEVKTYTKFIKVRNGEVTQ